MFGGAGIIIISASSMGVVEAERAFTLLGRDSKRSFLRASNSIDGSFGLQMAR